MIDKLQKGYKGKFGYQEGRFIQNIEEEDMPGPGTYIDPNQYVDRLQKNFDKKTYNFKSQSNRQVFGSNKKSVAPPVGNYQLDYYNLNRKMQKIKEEEAELEIKRPGFYSSQPRFDPLKREEGTIIYIYIFNIIIVFLFLFLFLFLQILKILMKNNYLKRTFQMENQQTSSTKRNSKRKCHSTPMY